MSLASQLLLGALSVLPATLAAPAQPAIAARDGGLEGPYTLTAYAPDNAQLHGAKVQNGGNMFQSTAATYCPDSVGSSCPNGTETVYFNTLGVSSMVPGGQDLYVAADGGIHITVQHSHSIPPGAYWYYYGWTWKAIERPSAPTYAPACPADDARFNCSAPTGYFTFHAPDAADGVGGVVACPYTDEGSDPTQLTVAYAVTPQFNRTDCVPIVGLATHNYTGSTPPVWSYLA